MDVLLLNKSSARCVKRLLSALHGFDVVVVESWPELTRRMHEGCDACVVVCAIRSERLDVADAMAEVARLALCKPMVVIDETFNTGLGKSLVAAGAQDYLPVHPLDSDELGRCLDWAVLRHAHLLHGRRFEDTSRDGLTEPSPATPTSGSLFELLESLSRREREVLHLLLAGLSVKRSARRLGTRPSTVYKQLASIRQKLGARSNHELVIFLSGNTKNSEW